MELVNILKNSKCYNCKHRLSKIIEPITQEDKEYYIDILELEDEDNYEIYLEQHQCLLTGLDIDGIVLKCNKFEQEGKIHFLKEYKF